MKYSGFTGRASWREFWGVSLLFAALTIALCWPLSLHPETQAMDLGPDTRLFLWTLGWDIHALTHDPLNFFDANIFYPEKATLAYSEHQLGAALTALPVWLLTEKPLLALNFVALTSIFLSALGTYLLGREIGLSMVASIFAGCVFAFAAPRFFRIGQLHLTTVQWIPLCLTAMHRYASNKSRLALIAGVGCFTLQAWSGGQNALFLSLTLSTVGLTLWICRQVSTPSLGDIGVAIGLLLALNLPFVLPYLELQQSAGLSRSLNEAEFWSPNWQSFLASPARVQGRLLELSGLAQTVMRDAKAYLFPGLLALVFALIGLVLPERKRDSPESVQPRASRKAHTPYPLNIIDGLILLFAAATIVVIASDGVFWPRLGIRATNGWRPLILVAGLVGLRLFFFRVRGSAASDQIARFLDGFSRFWSRRGGLVLGAYGLVFLVASWAALGPKYGMYAWLYRMVPGFDFIRVPSRLTLVSLLALSLLAGAGLDRLLSRVPKDAESGRRILGALAVVLVIIEYAAVPLATTDMVPPRSSLHQWLSKSQSESVPIVSLPFPDPRVEVDYARIQTLYMVYSMDHYQPMVNGYSGFIPAAQDEILRRVSQFPSEQAFDTLEQIGVRFGLIHRERYSEAEWRELRARLEGDALRSRWEKRYEDAEGLVLELGPGPAVGRKQ